MCEEEQEENGAQTGEGNNQMHAALNGNDSRMKTLFQK